MVMIDEPALAELLKTRLDSFSTILALPAVLVSLKVMVLPTSDELMVELPAVGVAEGQRGGALQGDDRAAGRGIVAERVAEPVAPVMLAEPAVAEPVNCSELLLTIVDEPAEELRLKVMKPEAAFVMFALPAVAVVVEVASWRCW